MHYTKQVKFYMCLILLQIAAVAAVSAQQATRTLIRTGHLLDVKTGAESAAQPLGNIAALTHTMEFHPVGDVGAGVKLALSRNVRLRLEVRDYISPSPSKVITPVPGATMGAWMNDIQAMVSLSYAFGNER